MRFGEIVLELWGAQLWTALPLIQASGVDLPATVEIAPIINTPQILVAIVAGVLMAIAFQLLLTNLGIAIGVTLLGVKWLKKSETKDTEDAKEAEEQPEKGNTARTIGVTAGFGILVSINFVLFVACFLAGKLSLVASPFVGGIVGVVIWAAYLLLLLWLSSSAVTSLVGTILGSAAAGLRGFVGAIAAVFNKEDKSPYMTETATINAIRQEVQSALKSDDMQDALKSYVSSLPAPQLDLNHVSGGLESILKSPEVLALAGSGLLSRVNRQTFVDLLRDRHDLSKKDAQRVIDQLETVWQQAVPQRSNPTGELLKLLKSAKPEDLQDSIAPMLQQLLKSSSHSSDSSSESSSGLLQTIQQNVDFGAVRRTLLSRVDLSDLDIEQMWNQIKALKQEDGAIEPSQPEAEPEPFNPITADLETFLLDAYPWQLKSEVIPATLRDILYDYEADPEQVRQQVEKIQPAAIEAILQQRSDLTEAEISSLVAQFKAVRQEVLETVKAAEVQLQLESWRSRLEVAWQVDKIQDGVRSLLSGDQHQVEALAHTLKFDRAILIQGLPQRLDAADWDDWVDRLETELAARQAVAQAIVSELWQKLKPYFRYTKVQQLTPSNVQRKLETLWEEVEAQFDDLPTPEFDWDKLESVLKRRKGMSADQLEEIVAQVRQTWTEFTSPSRRSTRALKVQFDRFTQAMSGYLLQDEATRPQLLQYLRQAGVELATLKRLRSTEWQSLKTQLQQQLTAAEVQQQLQQAQAIIRQMVKPPRRWATRTPSAAWDFSTQLQTYLQVSDRAELEAEAMRSSLSRLIADAEAQEIDSAEILQMSFDRAALTEALLHRPDLEEAEVEELLDRLESARSQLWEEAQQQQSHLQAAFEQLQSKLKQYLGSIQLPELNYDNIKHDVYKLLSLPQMGFEKLGDSIESLMENESIESLRDRLGQFNRDTVAALLQARDDVSEAVSGRVIEQVEGVRSQVMQQVEQVQLEAQRRLESLQRQAQRRAEETRKAAMIAAWWLFCTAVTSLTTAAIAGTLGVTGLHIGNWSL